MRWKRSEAKSVDIQMGGVLQSTIKLLANAHLEELITIGEGQGTSVGSEGGKERERKREEGDGGNGGSGTKRKGISEFI